MIGILICGHMNGERQKIIGGEYDTLYAQMFAAVDPTIELRMYWAVDGELPQDPNECDAWLVGGSPKSAFEDLPWINDLAAFIRTAHAAGSRMVGLCFGHQLIARSLGGEVQRSNAFSVGVHRVQIDEQPWFAGGTVGLHSFHQDVVTKLPPSSRVIGSSKTAAIPAYVIEDTALGIQYHPEITTALEAALIEEYSDRLGHEICAVGLESLSNPVHNELVAQWILQFLANQIRS